MSEIRFGDSFPALESYESVAWKEDEEHSVEFFPNIFFLVRLIKVNSPKLENYLHELEGEETIALDLEWDDELSLFQFCSCKKVLIIRHPLGEGNQVLQNFLKSHKFYAKGIHNDKIKLKEKFGQTFQENIEDIAKTRLVPHRFSENFMKMTLQFAGTPTAVFKDIRITVSDWSESHELTARQILYAAFDVVALYQAYPNFPPAGTKKTQINSTKKKHKRNANNEIIGKSRKSLENSTVRITKAVLKRDVCYPIHSYILYDYSKETDPFSLKAAFPACDRVSFYNGMLFITSKEKMSLDGNFIELSQLDYKLFNFHDRYFIKSLPSKLNMSKFNELLFCFGEDHQIQNLGYLKIHVHSAQTSLILSTFVPFIDFGGEKLEIYDFPYFIPHAIGIFPPFTDNNQILEFFNHDKHLKNVEFMRLRREDQLVKVILHFDTVENAEQSILMNNYRLINDFEVLLYRYSDENNIRAMRDSLITFYSTELTSKQLFDKFSVYGKVYLAYYDRRFQVGRIMFYDKVSLFKCLEKEQNCSIPIEGSTAFIRNLPLTITDEEVIGLIGSYGHLVDYVFRDLDQFMRYSIVEATFESIQDSVNLKNQLHHVKYKDMLLEINCTNNSETEAPIWKMQQRKQWIGIKVNNETDIDINNQCSLHGKVVNFKHIGENAYICFSTSEQARSALQDLDLDVFSIIVSDFTSVINKDQFEIVTTESIKRPLHTAQQTMVVIIDPMPDSLTKAQLTELLEEINDFEIIITKRVSKEGRRALIYTKSKKVMNLVYIKLEKVLVDGKILNIMRRMPSDVVKPPKKIPFEPLPSKKMPIVVDPIPDSWSEFDVYHLLKEAGKHSFKINGSSVETKKRRLIVEPRNTRAKVLCFNILNQQIVDGEPVVAHRLSHEDIMPSIDQSSDDDETKYSEIIE